MSRRSDKLFSAFLLPLGLCACIAGNLRSPATSVAQAGVAATTSLSTEHRDKAGQLRALDATEAFSRTYEFCAAVQPKDCKAQPSSPKVLAQREALARAISLRARAVDALGSAYGALQAEAAYDARADVQGATSDAIGAVNAYAAAVGAIPAGGGAGLLQPISKLASYGAGLIAERAQDRRIVRDSRNIAAATRLLRDALAREAYVFDSLTDYIGMQRTQATLDMLQSGLATYDSALRPLLADLKLTPVANAQSLVANSTELKTALAASLSARADAGVRESQETYRAAIGALDELIKAHSDLEARRTPSLAGLNARIAELNALLGPKKEASK